LGGVAGGTLGASNRVSTGGCGLDGGVSSRGVMCPGFMRVSLCRPPVAGVGGRSGLIVASVSSRYGLSVPASPCSDARGARPRRGGRRRSFMLLYEEKVKAYGSNPPTRRAGAAWLRWCSRESVRDTRSDSPQRARSPACVRTTTGSLRRVLSWKPAGERTPHATPTMLALRRWSRERFDCTPALETATALGPGRPERRPRGHAGGRPRVSPLVQAGATLDPNHSSNDDGGFCCEVHAGFLALRQ
jgi:hypothetical protein